jgi:hypothetical protein
MVKRSVTSERIEQLQDALQRIADWADAYSLDVFPEPDDAYWQRAHEVLKADGMTLDRLAADCMRHCMKGVGRIARAQLPSVKMEEG